MSQTQYLPLALKYRPKKFQDLMGQSVLVQTLSSAIINERIAPAYLLTGIRGVGKTTSARLIASIVNCENPLINGDNIEACGACSNCNATRQGNHPDIIEVDAASRTSVDDVRSIIESSEYRPLLGKYKIFIIDEVHMISKNAFNALLKTLEEPPAKILFIFATTEANKIPITILSRCQRFDLKRLHYDEITRLLSNIASKEKIEFDHNAISLIALKADGSARDGISMLDQASLIAASSNEKIIGIELVRSMLAITSLDVVVSFLDHILKRDTKAALDILATINTQGLDFIYFIENILDMIGYISKLSILPEYREKEYDSYQEILKAMASKNGLEILTILWQIFSKSILELKTSHNQFLALEMLVLKAIYATTLPTSIEAIESLENRGLPRP
jgi:DNA polymerase-3 subunit gamma/tau